MAGRAVWALAIVLALPFVLTSAAPNGPHLFRSVNGDLEVMLPAAVLREREVQRQLASGLTTSFLTSIDVRDGKGLVGALRVDVRYELWDETYLVTELHMTRPKQTQTLHSFEHFVDWWSRTRFHLGHIPTDQGPRNVRLKMELVPFSAGEEADAKHWLAHSIGEAAEPLSTQHSGGAGEPSGGSILDLIIATSMHRKTVQSWQWTLPLERP